MGEAVVRDKLGKAPVSVGGKGMARRKVKRTVKPSVDGKRVDATLKKLGLQPFPLVEAVSFFRTDGTVLTIKGPAVQVAPASSTFCISGRGEESIPDHSSDGEDVPDLRDLAIGAA